MNEKDFESYLKKCGKRPHVIEKLITQAAFFEKYLKSGYKIKIDSARNEHIEAYINKCEQERAGRGKKYARAIALYYRHIGNNALADFASGMRQAEIEKKRKPFLLKNYRDIDRDTVARLANIGIVNVEQMLENGCTPNGRKKLSKESGVRLENILMLTRLSDLSRLFAVKGVRALLYYEAGIDSIEKLASWDPEELRTYLIKFIEKTNFDGIAPLPKEMESTIKSAKKLKPIVK